MNKLFEKWYKDKNGWDYEECMNCGYDAEEAWEESRRQAIEEVLNILKNMNNNETCKNCESLDRCCSYNAEVSTEKIKQLVEVIDEKDNLLR